MPSQKHSVLILIFLLLIAAPVSAAEWRCRASFESTCGKGECKVDESLGKAIEVNFDEEGHIEVCLYSGCYKGQGSVSGGQRFMVITGNGIPWESPVPNDRKDDLLFALDRRLETGSLMVAGFNQPMYCKEQKKREKPAG